MVEGLQENIASPDDSRPLLVVDLDGTLIAGNSLHIYIRCAMRQMARRGRLDLLARTAALLGLRKVKAISHARMKFGILGLVRPDERLLTDFRRRVEAIRRKDVAMLIDGYKKKGYAVLLATAAADTYVPAIWEGNYVATDMADPARIECRGEEKLRRVEAYARARGLRLAAAITDEPAADDAPLAQAAEELWDAETTPPRQGY